MQGRWPGLIHFADYTLDTHGNWTQRTHCVVAEQEGKEILTPYQTIYREIRYYE